MSRCRPWLFGLLSVGLFAGGCSSGKDTTKTAQVSGTVKLDGKPLDEGDITFVGEPGTIPDALPIRNGAFEGKIKPGKKKVEVRAYRKEKPPPSATAGVTDSLVNYIPEQFNTRTTLTAEVSEGGVTPNAFEVKSK